MKIHNLRFPIFWFLFEVIDNILKVGYPQSNIANAIVQTLGNYFQMSELGKRRKYNNKNT